MTFRSMIDAAFPVVPPQVMTDIVLIYVGGDTPNPMSDAAIAKLPQRYRYPTWVRSNPNGGPQAIADATQFVAWLIDHKVPSGSHVILDLETAVDTAYVMTFDAALLKVGYKTTKYGSLSSIWQNPKTSGGTFVANPTGVPHMLSEGDTVATQYDFAGAYDLSLVFNQADLQLWDTQSTTTPTPVPPKQIQQSGWNWCDKCQSLFYGPKIAQSVCPSGGLHSNNGSGNYTLTVAP